jgi:hypothetical protein
MITPSGMWTCFISLTTGRFQPNTRLCFSFSDFHPKEWNPSWQVSTILVGLLSFMVLLSLHKLMKTSDAITAGSISATPAERRRFAQISRRWNSTQNPKFLTEFPDEHAANLGWLRKEEEESQEERQESHGRTAQDEIQQSLKNRKDTSGTRKWVMIGVIGVLVALRAWQRYKQHIVE